MSTKNTRLKLTLSRAQVHALWYDADQHAIVAEDPRTAATWQAIAREAKKALQRVTEKERDKRQLRLPTASAPGTPRAVPASAWCSRSPGSRDP